MKIKNYIIAFQFLLLFVVIILSVTIRHNVCSLENAINKESDDKAFMESMYIQDNILSSIRSNGQTIVLEKLHFNTPKLVCYYSSQTCEGCVTFATQKIKEFFPDIDTNPDILFVAANFNAKMKLQHTNAVRIGTQKTGTELDNSMYVCYFILNNGRIEHLFIPEKNYAEYTDSYLKEIQKRYFIKK